MNLFSRSISYIYLKVDFEYVIFVGFQVFLDLFQFGMTLKITITKMYILSNISFFGSHLFTEPIEGINAYREYNVELKVLQIEFQNRNFIFVHFTHI